MDSRTKLPSEVRQATILTNHGMTLLTVVSNETIPSQLWPRMYSAFTHGDIVITLGTGKLTRKLEQSQGLVGEHAYAVLDLKQADDRRLLLVKNPWSEGLVWKGCLTDDPSDAEGGDWVNDLHRALP